MMYNNRKLRHVCDTICPVSLAPTFEQCKALMHFVYAGKAKGSALDMCKALLEEFRVASGMFQMGKTRLFFRAGVLGHLEDTWARIQK